MMSKLNPALVRRWAAAYGYGVIENATGIRLIDSEGEWLEFTDAWSDARLGADLRRRHVEQFLAGEIGS